MKTKFIMILTFLSCFGYSQDMVGVFKRKTVFPIGLFSKKNSSIYGVSVGIGSNIEPTLKNNSTNTNGLRLEPISDALLIVTLIFGPETTYFPTKETDFIAFGNKLPNEIINGMNISSGTNAFVKVNGITISAVSQLIKQSNGISITGFGSSSFKNNGLQIAGAGTSATISNGFIGSFLNTEVFTGKGLQIGGFNQYVNFTGLQIGIFNDVEGESKNFTGLQIGFLNNAKKLKGIQLGLWNSNEKRSLPFINW